MVSGYGECPYLEGQPLGTYVTLCALGLNAGVTSGLVMHQEEQLGPGAASGLRAGLGTVAAACL